MGHNYFVMQNHDPYRERHQAREVWSDGAPVYGWFEGGHWECKIYHLVILLRGLHFDLYWLLICNVVGCHFREVVVRGGGVCVATF